MEVSVSICSSVCNQASVHAGHWVASGEVTYLLWGCLCCCGFLAQASVYLTSASDCVGFNICVLAVAPVAAKS